MRTAKGKPGDGPTKPAKRAASKRRVGTDPARSSKDVQRALNELRTRQTELELRNKELRRSRRELKEVLQRYVRLFEAAPVGYMTLDAKGIIHSVNITAARMFGRDARSLVKTPLSACVLRRDAETLGAHLQKVFGTPGTWWCELRLACREKATKYVELHSAVVQEYARGTARCLTSIIDITGHTRVDDALRASRQRLRLALAASRMGVWEWDLRTDAVFWSPECVDLLGVKKAARTLRSFTDLLHPADAARVMSAARKAIADKSVFREEFRTIRPDGRDIWLSSVGHVEYDDAGAPLRFIGTVRDISESKALQTEVAKREQWLSSFFMGATAGLALLDTDLRYIRINGTLADMNGLPAAAHIGRTIHEVLPRLADMVEPVFRQVLATGRPVLNLEVAGETPRQPGVHRYWLESFFPVKGAEGNPQGVGAIVVEITGLKQAEKALRESEERFQLAMRGATDGLWDWNLVTGEVYYSPRWKSMLGYAEDELENSLNTWEGLLHREDREAALAKVREFLEERTGKYEVEFRLRHKEGHYVDILSRGFMVRDDHGKPLRLVGTHVDVTERKRAESALRESERKYRDLFESSNDVIVFLDREGNIIDINRRGAQVTGYSQSELRQMNAFQHLIVPEDQATIRQVVRDAFEGRARTYEERWRTKRGDLIYFDGVTVPRRSSEGEVLSTFCTLRDITERKRVEEKLRQNERDLAEAQRMARLGNWRYDIAANTVRWSEELYRIFDVEKTEFGGLYESFISRVHPDDKPLVQEKSRRARETGEPFEVEYRIVARAGQLKHIREVGYAIKDATGRVVGLFGTAQDITFRKKAEEDLQDYQNALRALALELSLMEERERHRIATDLHDHISQTLALASIKLGALVECRDLTGLPAGVDNIRKLVEQAIEYTRSLTLELSPPVLYELGLVPGLSELAEQFQVLHNIEVEVRDDGQPKELDNDRLIALYKAVRELLMNIVKHANARQAIITLTRDAGRIRITVEDDGTGFNASDMKPYGSAGSFGLFSTRERLRGIGGRMEVASAPGKGTKVTIEAPLQQ